jgi:hypothetical protein
MIIALTLTSLLLAAQPAALPPRNPSLIRRGEAMAKINDALNGMLERHGYEPPRADKLMAVIALNGYCDLDGPSVTTSVSAYKDVKPNHPQFDAIQSMVERYGAQPGEKADTFTTDDYFDLNATVRCLPGGGRYLTSQQASKLLGGGNTPSTLRLSREQFDRLLASAVKAADADIAGTP